MDPLSLVAEHCADSGHTFAFQNAKILGRGNDRVARETIEAWHTETTSINRCVALPTAYQALRTQLNELKSKREVRPDVNPNTGEPTTDLNVATPQIGPDEGAVINTVASTTTPADGEKRGTTYEQVKGTPMGSPLSGFIAEAVLQKVETLVFSTYKPKFWARYVDDTFVIIKRQMVKEFHDVLNSVFPDIQFTMEAEVNNQLPFLDVLVHRNPNGHLKTTVYRKATNTRQILSFHSKHPLGHKRSCVRTLYRRAETHCSEPDDRRSELRYLQRLFMANGYPRNFIERGRQAGPSRRLVTERPTIWRALPYIDGVSEAVSRLLRPLGIGIAHRPESTIRHLVMRPKAPLPLGETTNVIYRIRCNSCEVNYIGETDKRLQTRVGEHMRAVRRMDPLSLVAEHCADAGHTFAFQHAEILGRGNDRIARETIEAWHTGTTSINRCVTLPAAYQALRAQLNIFEAILQRINATSTDARMKKRAELNDKLQSLLCPTDKCSMSARVVNLSKRSLTPAEISLLSKGLKFNHTDAAPTNFLASLESLLLVSAISADVRADIRSCASGLLRQRKRHRNLTIDEEKGLRSL
nr:unnamed protein product [Spirometra erinaceieuropaei]